MKNEPQCSKKQRKSNKLKKNQKNTKICLTNHTCNVIIDVLVNDTSLFFIGLSLLTSLFFMEEKV